MGAKHFLWASVFIVVGTLSHPAFCQDAPATGSAQAQTAKPDSTKPQIITDEQSDTVRVLIGGREILTIDAEGLHVTGNIELNCCVLIESANLANRKRLLFSK